MMIDPKWKATIMSSTSDARWDGYDCDIVRVVNEFNRHLSGVASYGKLDWKLIKAMVWTESGGPDNRAWKTRPMQIGNPGDPGLRSLFSGREGGELILGASNRTLTQATAISSPQMNIRAGVAYLLMRLARFEVAEVKDEVDKKTYEIVVKPGDSFDKIARQNGTTIATLSKLNGRQILRPGAKIIYQKSAMRKVIAGWAPITTAAIATRYNVGDSEYAAKLDFCLSAMRTTTEGGAKCVQ
jgi:hypothetical protein